MNRCDAVMIARREIIENPQYTIEINVTNVVNKIVDEYNIKLKEIALQLAEMKNIDEEKAIQKIQGSLF